MGFVCTFHRAARVRVPSTPSMLFPIYIVQIVYLSFELECEKNENEQKVVEIGPFFKKENGIKVVCVLEN